MSGVGNLSPDSIKTDAWLAEVMERPVFKVTADPEDPRRAARAFQDHLAAQDKAFYFAKVPTDQVASVRALSQAGFYVVDVNVVFEWDSLSPAATGAVRHEIRVASPQQGIEAAAVATKSFTRSRFHLDPGVEDSVADRIKREWVINYARQERGDTLLVSLKDDRVVGFLAALVSREPAANFAVIELVAVAPEARGHGCGRALVERFVERYRNSCAALRVGTQAANLRSLAFYERQGFRIAETQYVLHAHADSRRGRS